MTKASHDLRSAVKLADGSDSLLDSAIYHCQQAVEKALKGYLTFRDRRFEKTHDLEVLVDLAVPDEPRFADWLDAAEILTPYAVAFRYPPDSAGPSRGEFNEALELAQGFCTFVQSLLPPESIPAE